MGSGWLFDPAGREWYRQGFLPPGNLEPTPPPARVWVGLYDFYVDPLTGNLNIQAPNGSTMTLVSQGVPGDRVLVDSLGRVLVDSQGRVLTDSGPP